MKVVAIIQARMSSSRLPGKVMLDIAGKPMLRRVVDRVRRARLIDGVVVATTKEKSDHVIGQYCYENFIPCAMGSLNDVLDRYYMAAHVARADVIVRVTADCPVIDPDVMDEAVSKLEIANCELGNSQPAISNLQFDFVCNRLPPPFTRTFPIGLDVEVCTFSALERAWKESTETFHREHVMPYIYEGVALTTTNHQLSTGVSPRGFKIAQLHNAIDYGSHRWTVDTPEDLTFIREVFARLQDKPNFTWHDVLHVVENEPELTKINSGVRHKTMKETDERSNV
jgi:spore coat polysaccharide biosynthesis protein SpsF